MIDTETPGIEERYLTATMSSNMRLETREDAPVGAAGVMVAAGWSRSRIGAALIRLHSKVDRNGLEQVHGQIVVQAVRLGIERPEAVAASVLAWWMAKNCRVCTGRKFELIPGAPGLSNRQCKACRGTGEAKLAYGESGKRLAGWLDGCVEDGRASIGRRLRRSMGR